MTTNGGCVTPVTLLCSVDSVSGLTLREGAEMDKSGTDTGVSGQVRRGGQNAVEGV